MPTVVPCRSVSRAEFVLAEAMIFSKASAMARDGSSGVENSFRVLRLPASVQTQSVKVPPVSMAIRSSESWLE